VTRNLPEVAESVVCPGSRPAAERSIPRRLTRLRSALRAERRRGISGHWTYDLARHIELLRIYRAELAAISRYRIGSSALGESP
jgi:hypothetical protein